MLPRHLIFLIAIDLIWGFNLIAGKIGVNEFPPVLFSAMRFAVLGLLLAPYLRVHRGQMRDVVIVALAAGGLPFSIFYIALSMAGNVSMIAIAAQLSVPFATILSVIFLHEQVRWRRWLGIALAFAGVAVIGFDASVLAYVPALALTVLGSLIGAAGLLLVKRLHGVGVFQLQAWIAWLSWPVLLLVSLLIERGQLEQMRAASGQAWAALMYTAIFASLIGNGGLYWLLRRYEVSLVTPLTLLATVFSVAFAVLLLGDELTPRMITGGICTLTGVLIIAVRQGVRHPERAVRPVPSPGRPPMT